MPQSAGRRVEAMESASVRPDPPMGLTLGLAMLARASSSPADTQVAWEALKARALANAEDSGALLDLGTLLIATGSADQGLELQAAAIARQKLYRRPVLGPTRLRLLAFMRHGDFTANTPLDFLLEESGVELIQCYLDAPPSWDQVPDHDVAFLSIGEDVDAAPLLARLENAFDTWPRPVLNNRPALIAGLTRDGVYRALAGAGGVLSPPVRSVERDHLDRIAAGEAPAEVLGAAFAFPLIVRPYGTHAGLGMEKLDGAAALAAYLADQPGQGFYVTNFVDYAGPDRLYRKYRIVFIEGRPFLSHMAVSPRWMVHYLNADMQDNAANRAEEARAMESFDAEFASRHADAFRRLCEAFPLDYFGIDCAETPDGRLLVFEADVAMIVHAMDPDDVYPYKKPAMAKLFKAFDEMLQGAASSGRMMPKL